MFSLVVVHQPVSFFCFIPKQCIHPFNKIKLILELEVGNKGLREHNNLLYLTAPLCEQLCAQRCACVLCLWLVLGDETRLEVGGLCQLVCMYLRHLSLALFWIYIFRLNTFYYEAMMF